MKLLSYIIFLLLINFLQTSIIFAQQNINDIFEKTLSYRGLIKEDFTFPISFDEPSPTNSSKLILPLVKDLMINPLNSHKVLDKISVNQQYEQEYEILELINLFTYNDNRLVVREGNILRTYPEVYKYLIDLLNFNYHYKNDRFKELGEESLNFLQNNYQKILSGDEGGNSNDIFEFNRDRDSSWLLTKKVYDVLSMFSKEKTISQPAGNLALIQEIRSFFKGFGLQNQELKKFKKFLEDNELENDYFKIIIGGFENENHKFDNTDKIIMVIDFGGNDVYELNKNVKFIFDLSGEDLYSASEDQCLASAFFDNSFIYDKSGDDKYIGKNFSIGSAICGMAGIIDEAGNDFYSGQTFTLGAGLFGVGFILDNNGNDIYNAISYSQGFSMTQGIGMLIDNKGNDSYLIDSRSLDVTRYSDHYVSMNQGFSYGLRPFYAGGVGLLLDNEGNDIYNSDIFGQGSAYWYALGILMDKNGNDKYNSYQYSQGGGIHFAVGLLKDYNGTDFYSTNGVSQGCGHDVGFGMLHDVAGDDNYSAIGLSQGAGNANGIGVFIDETGSDGYLNRTPSNTRGYGNYRRDYGSLGVFLDASGTDFYSMPGQDSIVISGATYGISDDYFLQSLQEPVIANNSENEDSGKIRTPGERGYSQDELFIMAKTIEPKFADKQKLGFDRLVSDSSNTARYILKYLGSYDHRDLLVLTNLIQKIGYSMNMVFKDEINKYLMKQNDLNKFEVAYMCSLIGFTKDAELRNELLELTYDKSDRVVSEAINALGKIDYDKSDNRFINNVSYRFSEISNAAASKGLLKNIAFAINNYYSPDNVSTLLNLCAYNFYGVRFNASDALKKYANDFYNEIAGNINSTDIVFVKQAFINSFQSLDDSIFMNFVDSNKENLFQSDEMKITTAQITLLEMRSSTNPDFQSWGDILIKEVEVSTSLKVR